ncbi:MAG: hypothetical protein JSS27_10185 [Planctomycetes bacterium]|nr:hypothetical protein [Planctomycetota bacterium]
MFKKFSLRLVMLAVTLGFPLAPRASADDFEREPINYSRATPRNRVSRLIEELASGKAKLEHRGALGYLPSLLAALDVPVSSQTLVYSKTSLQRNRIAPATPRALYFSDDVYVGFCQQGDVLEISAADPKLGAVFYTLEQNEAAPRLQRQGDNCLICHGSSPTKNVPGHLVRSVFVHPSGLPILSAATYRIDQSSPLEQRWGGWYVTGTHGSQRHLGNLVIDTRDVPDVVDNSAGQNVTDLARLVDTAPYLTKHSDIVALMVLEHQAEAHNRITQANFGTRQALHYQTTLNRELREPADHQWDSTRSRIRSVGEPLVEYLLFSGEAPLTHRVAGTSEFAAEFARHGPRDSRGRSLRDFDLERRLFRYPCSYLVYSESVRALPPEVKAYVFDRLWSIVSDEDHTQAFAHLSLADRQAIREILADTLPDLPVKWRESVAAK